MHEDPSTQSVARRRSLSQDGSQIAYLQVLSGQQAGFIVRLDSYGLLMGRASDCQLMLEEPGISRTHARISWEQGDFWLEDLQSTNGTFLNDREVGRHRLCFGDRIELGETTSLKFDQASQDELDLAEKLYDCATRDSLTRALNRGSLVERLQQEIAYCQRHKRQLSLVMLDVDYFKKVNDTFGHPAGDFVLRFLAEQLRRHLRLEDVLGRYGGEEFALLLRQTALPQALETAERLRAAVQACRPQFEEVEIPFTISLGVAALQSEDTLEALLSRSDAALYEAKRAGRNRVMSAS
jgi:two-component system cell cycle response regulator